MIKINRKVKSAILKHLTSNKVVILLGARRTGKTFLIKEITENYTYPYLFFNGEDFSVHQLFENRSIQNYRQILGKARTLIIDEAQKIPNIGQILKLIVDEIEGIKILVTGSSAFDIYNVTGEPLTGRKITYTLFPFSEEEYTQHEKPYEKFGSLKNRLIYGNYPELIHMTDNNEKSEYLKEIINSYLLKDILTFENIKNSDKIFKLLKLIAFQIGSEVSYQELGNNLSLSKNTVEKYLDLLSKVFILHKAEGFSRNLRKEVTKSPRWYFFDNGIRNTIIANFSHFDNRNDIGQLWENYVIAERLKYQHNNRIISNNYFWRTYDQQEIDWLEDKNGVLSAFEIKWKEQKLKPPGSWSKAYPDAKYNIIHSNNYTDFLLY